MRLDEHIRYLRKRDAGSRDALAAHWESCGPVWAEIDKELSACRRPVELIQQHDVECARAARCAAVLEELDFQTSPRREQWVRFARHDRRKTQILSLWEHRLGALFRGEAVRIYGGLKNCDAVERKIARAGRDGSLPDCWDVVRLRVVVAHSGKVLDTATAIRERYADSVIRCRNYIANPRADATAMYRGSHLALQSDDEEAVEVQIVTRRREAVGLLDHAFVLKGRVCFASAEHRHWLRHFSCMANVLDSRGWIA